MAGFGISVLDLARAIKLSKDIYAKCFIEDPATVKYQHFINDIGALGASLERLDVAVQENEKQYPRREWHSGAHQLDATEHLWPKLTGDFHKTLRECDSLLARHGHLSNGRPKIATNLRWWLSAESQVDNLVARLRLHSEKVEFYSTPSQFEAVTRHGRDLQQLRRQVANLERMMIHGVEQSPTPWADVLSSDLEANIEFGFDRDRPAWSAEGVKWPLKESFKAFAFHFARGTVRFNPSPELGIVPDLLQHLDLAKSIWILEKIRQSSTFRAASTESRWAEHMREFEDDTRGQLHRFETGELQKPPEQQLLEFSSSNPGIKTGEETRSDPLDADTAGPLEEKILQIDLVSDCSTRESSLSVFRETESDFRLMTSTRQADTEVTQHDQDFEVNMEKHRLVPAYTNPSQGCSPRHNLLIFNDKGKKPRMYDFLESTDVRKLQRALTGHRVHHDMPLSRWCINGSERPGDAGKGTLQLWQFKPLQSTSSSRPSQASDAVSSLGSARSPAPNFGRPEPPQVNYAELAASTGGNADSVDFLGWPGFPDAPVADASRRRESQHSSYATLMGAQYRERTKSTALSGTTRYGDVGSPESGRSFANGSNSTVRSRNGSQQTQQHSRTASGTTAITRTSVMSPVRGPRGDGTELVKAQLPALVIFTICNGKWSFLHLSLNANIYVEPKSCGCRNPKMHCDRVILESKKSFSIRVLSADQDGERGLESWDLSVFRYPQPSEKLKKTTIKERVKTLELQFRDEDEKNDFLDELQSLVNVRTVDHNEYERSLRERREREARNTLR